MTMDQEMTMAIGHWPMTITKSPNTPTMWCQSSFTPLGCFLLSLKEALLLFCNRVCLLTAGDCLPAVLSALTTQVENIAGRDEKAKLESESIIVKVTQVENIARQDKKAKLESESVLWNKNYQDLFPEAERHYKIVTSQKKKKKFWHMYFQDTLFESFLLNVGYWKVQTFAIVKKLLGFNPSGSRCCSFWFCNEIVRLDSKQTKNFLFDLISTTMTSYF